VSREFYFAAHALKDELRRHFGRCSCRLVNRL